MKVKFNSKNMAFVLSGMSKVIQSKAILSIMQDYMLEVERDVLTIVAMNTQCCVRNKIEVQSDFDKPFSFCVDAAMFTSFVNKIDGDVEMSFKDKTLYLKHKYGKMNMVFESSDNFPIVVVPNEYKSFSISGDILLSMISEVAEAVEVGCPERPILASVCMDIIPGRLNVAATDKFVMRIYSTDIETEDTAQMMVSPYIADVIKKYIKGKEVEVRYDGTRTYFICDDTYIYDINVEGTYPKYDVIIEKTNTGVPVELLASSFKDSLDRQYALSDGYVKFNIDNELHILSKNKMSSGDIQEDIQTMNNPGAFEGYFKVENLKSIMDCINGDVVKFMLCDKVKCLYVNENLNGIDKKLLTMQVMNLTF